MIQPPAHFHITPPGTVVLSTTARELSYFVRVLADLKLRNGYTDFSTLSMNEEPNILNSKAIIISNWN